jgi:hypothetical protein
VIGKRDGRICLLPNNLRLHRLIAFHPYNLGESEVSIPFLKDVLHNAMPFGSRGKLGSPVCFACRPLHPLAVRVVVVYGVDFTVA